MSFSGKVLADFEALVTGTVAEVSQPTYRFLVRATDPALARDDLVVAAGIGRAMAATGAGVTLVPRSGWYRDHPPGSIVVSLLPEVEPRRISSKVTLIGWVRERLREWLAMPGLAAFDGLAALSTIAQRELVRRFLGPVALCQIAVDPELFSPRSAPPVSATAGDLTRDGRRLSMAERVQVHQQAWATPIRIPRHSIGHGNLPNRILEALSCGSLPILNSAVGLAELGLDQVPIARSATRTEALIAEIAAGQWADLTAELSSRVRSEHHWLPQANRLAELGSTLATTPRRRVVDCFPDYSWGNPFQRQIYAAVPAHHGQVIAALDPTHLVSRDSGEDLRDRVIHLHWLHDVVQSAPDLGQAWSRLDHFTAALSSAKNRGARVVWTVHNVMPHQVVHYFAELELRRIVAAAADVIHIMADSTLSETADLYRLDPKKVVRIPHPSYAGVYPVVIDRALARTRQGHRDGDLSLLFFGQVRAYKGIADLLDAMVLLRRKLPRVSLQLAGRIDPDQHQSLADRLHSDPTLRTWFGHIPDDQLQVLLLAADLMVLPYHQVLNSGAMVLAATFGLPVVLPDIPAFAGLRDTGFVELFTPGDPADLTETIERATRSLTTATARQAALSWAQQFDPGPISARVVSELLGWGEG